MKIQSFIFNWPGKTQYAVKLEQDLLKLGFHPTVINSDSDYQPFNWINLGNTAYFGAQWALAVDLFNSDMFFHVQADVEYQDWLGFLTRARYFHRHLKWGVWAPDVKDNTFWAKPISRWQTPDPSLQLVGNSDCTCWLIDGSLISQFKKLPINWKSNFYGWGMDSIICALSYLNKQPVIRDSMHKIIHHTGRGYATDQAYAHMQVMLNQLPCHVKTVVDLCFSNSDDIVTLLK